MRALRLPQNHGRQFPKPTLAAVAESAGLAQYGSPAGEFDVKAADADAMTIITLNHMSSGKILEQWNFVSA